MKFEKLTDEIKKENIVISASGLIEFSKSPKHYYSKYILKEIEPTKAMEEGTIIHKALLEPDKFDEQYSVLENKDNFICTIDQLNEEIKKLNCIPVKGKKRDLINQLLSINPSAKIWDDYLLQKAQEGKIFVSSETMNACKRMQTEIKNNKWLSRALIGGMTEQSAWWRHDSGVIIPMRLDYYHPELGINKLPVIIDLKSSVCAEKSYFSKQIRDNKLHIQAAIYVDGVKAITGIEPLYVWAVIEKDIPYCLEVYAADNETIEEGRKLYTELIAKYLECLKNNSWPGYSDGYIKNISVGKLWK